ncbi:NAD-dependent epimerase/dehydratase family protein [Mariniflexile sp.]|uniref:NAD-dependent epimerase/dehydratase family protein n=1 Tax=Mariniflexile sp. TaxID=1979402 RepID=UPI0035684964
MQTLLLTGATGFLGSHLLEIFISNGFNVVILKRSTSDTWRINHLLPKIKWYDSDMVSLKAIFTEVKPDVIVHTACNYGRKKDNLFEILDSNLIFGIKLLEEAIANEVKTFINTDTLLPVNVNNYSLSKNQFVQWLKLQSDKIQVINIRPEYMYGPKDDKNKFTPWLIDKMINSSEEINLTSGIQKRDFIYIEDVVSAYLMVVNEAQNLPKWNQFDLGTNTFVEVKEFILAIGKEIEKVYNIDVVSKLKFGVIPYREGDIMVPELDNKALLKLGWKPKFSLDEGIKITIEN